MQDYKDTWLASKNVFIKITVYGRKSHLKLFIVGVDLREKY